MTLWAVSGQRLWPFQSSENAICEDISESIISSQMQDRHTKIGQSCWQTALETESRKTTQRCQCSVRLIVGSMTGCQWRAYLDGHKVDVYELEGGPDFPIHLQSCPVTASHLLIKILPPFSLRKGSFNWLHYIRHAFYESKCLCHISFQIQNKKMWHELNNYG